MIHEPTELKDCSHDDLVHSCCKIEGGEHAGQCARVKSFTDDSKVLAEVAGVGEVLIPSFGVRYTDLPLSQVWLSGDDIRIVSRLTNMIVHDEITPFL